MKKRMNQDTITELMHGYYKEKGEYGKQKAALLRLLSLVIQEGCTSCIRNADRS